MPSPFGLKSGNSAKNTQPTGPRFKWNRHVTRIKKNMAAVSRLFRLSTFTVAAGAALKISKDVTDRTRNSSPNSNLELVLVQIAFRHGARTPIFPAPCQELEPVTWQADLLMGALPYTDFDYELKHVSGGARPFSKYDDRQMKKILKVVSCCTIFHHLSPSLLTYMYQCLVCIA